MQIVINIPEEIYFCIIRDGYFFDNETNIIRQAIKNGTPLPKGHGRLIDADAVLEEPIGNTYKDIDIAETIIEADAESEGKELKDEKL